MLTGNCGPNDEGRQVLLQNRNPSGSVRVTTETSRWTRGDFKSSSRDLHVLARHQEKRLGCTHLSGDVELRYALAKASGNSEKPDGWRDHSAPPRDFISLVESGICDQQGEGQRIMAVNRHSNRCALARSLPFSELLTQVFFRVVQGILNQSAPNRFRLAPRAIG